MARGMNAHNSLDMEVVRRVVSGESEEPTNITGKLLILRG
jgi:hypothetical protein